jgi:type IV secretion system protein VirB8
MLPEVPSTISPAAKSSAPVRPLGPSAQDIAAMVQSGEYFSEARAWYRQKYILPIAQRSLLLMLVVLGLIVIGYNLKSIVDYGELRRIVRLVMPVEDTASLDAKLIRIAPDPHMNRNMAMVRYLLGEYVTLRETYDPYRITPIMRQVYGMSAPEETKRYYQAMQASNPASPIRRYEERLLRQVSIDQVTWHMLADQAGSDTATVAYTVQEQENGVARTFHDQAEVDFTWTPFTFGKDAASVKPYQFQVTGYRSHGLLQGIDVDSKGDINEHR